MLVKRNITKLIKSSPKKEIYEHKNFRRKLNLDSITVTKIF